MIVNCQNWELKYILSTLSRRVGNISNCLTTQPACHGLFHSSSHVRPVKFCLNTRKWWQTVVDISSILWQAAARYAHGLSMWVGVLWRHAACRLGHTSTAGQVRRLQTHHWTYSASTQWLCSQFTFSHISQKKQKFNYVLYMMSDSRDYHPTTSTRLTRSSRDSKPPSRQLIPQNSLNCPTLKW